MKSLNYHNDANGTDFVISFEGHTITSSTLQYKGHTYNFEPGVLNLKQISSELRVKEIVVDSNMIAGNLTHYLSQEIILEFSRFINTKRLTSKPPIFCELQKIMQELFGEILKECIIGFNIYLDTAPEHMTLDIIGCGAFTQMIDSLPNATAALGLPTEHSTYDNEIPQ